MPITKARLRISDYNEKRKARLRHQERRIRMVSLSLTSMVDMFAILVIFLLSNSASVSQWIEVSPGIDLPKARASDPPPKAAALQISKEFVFANNKPLIAIPKILGGPATIDAVRAWLVRNAKKDGYVNIVAHQKIQYGVVKRVIATCQEAGFGNVNLAVQPSLPPK